MLLSQFSQNYQLKSLNNFFKICVYIPFLRYVVTSFIPNSNEGRNDPTF